MSKLVIESFSSTRGKLIHCQKLKKNHFPDGSISQRRSIIDMGNYQIQVLELAYRVI